MEEQTNQSREKLLEWSVMDFKFNLRYIAWRGYTEKKYNEIMNKK